MGKITEAHRVTSRSGMRDVSFFLVQLCIMRKPDLSVVYYRGRNCLPHDRLHGSMSQKCESQQWLFCLFFVTHSPVWRRITVYSPPVSWFLYIECTMRSISIVSCFPLFVDPIKNDYLTEHVSWYFPTCRKFFYNIDAMPLIFRWRFNLHQRSIPANGYALFQHVRESPWRNTDVNLPGQMNISSTFSYCFFLADCDGQ